MGRLGARCAQSAEGRDRAPRWAGGDRLAAVHVHDELDVHAAGNRAVRQRGAVLFHRSVAAYGSRGNSTGNPAAVGGAGIGGGTSGMGKFPAGFQPKITRAEFGRQEGEVAALLSAW